MKDQFLLLAFCLVSFFGYGQVDSLGIEEKLNELSGLVKKYHKEGNIKEAIIYGKKALEFSKENYGAKHKHYNSSLHDLAYLYHLKGLYDIALPMYLESLNLTEKIFGKNHIEYGMRLNNMTVFYYESGKIEKALTLYPQILKILELNVGKNHEWYGLVLNNYAQLYKEIGDYYKAIPLQLKATKIIESVLGKENSQYATHLYNLGLIYHAIGHFNKALLMIQEALVITEESQGKDHPEYSFRLNGLGVLYHDMGQADKALPFQLEAIEVLKRTIGKEHRRYSLFLNNLASIYQELFQYDNAIKYYLEALHYAEENLVNNHVERGRYLNNLGTIYLRKENYKKALSLYFEALEAFEDSEIIKHKIQNKTLLNIGRVFQLLGQDDKAIPYYEKVSKSQIKLLFELYPSLSELERIQYLKSLNIDFKQILHFCLENPEISNSVQNLYLAFKGLALEGSIESRSNILTSSNSFLLDKHFELIAIRRKIVEAYSKSSQNTKKKIEIDSLHNIAELLEGELSRASSALAAQFDPDKKRQITLQDLKEELAENEATIEFLHFQYYNGNEWTDSTLYCALLTRPGYEEPKFITLTEDKTLQKILKTSVAQQSDNYITNPQKGYELWQLLWKPLEPHLEGVTKIHLSPSGLLHQVAFDALSAENEGNQFVGDSYELAYHGTLRDFVLKKSYGEHGKSITLVGGAEYDLDSISMSGLVQNFDNDLTALPREKPLEIGGIKIGTRSLPEDSTRNAVRFGYLPGTKEEVTNIAGQFQNQNWQVKSYTDKQALEDRVKAESGENAPAILHLATHGYFFKPFEGEEKYDNTLGERIITSENPLLRSGLVFTGVNHTWQGGQPIPGMEDGVLTAYEISNLDLLNTNLVVLSACETGLGDVHDAEGVFGLQRAFKTAGVENLIVSLWKVPDAETSELMQLFYKNYLEGDSIRTAFRKAQRVMREKVPPFYWAGFVLIE